MYSQTFWDHVRNPRNNNDLPSALVGKASYHRCGDRLTLYLKIENGRIAQAAFQAKACAPVVAVASLMTEKIKGLEIAKVSQLDLIGIDQEIGGLPPSKRHAYLVFLECLHKAVEMNTISENCKETNYDLEAERRR